MSKSPALFNLSTESFGAQINIKPASIRVRLCRTGSYFGIRPRKLPNGRLLWPEDASEQLMAGVKDQSGA